MSKLAIVNTLLDGKEVSWQVGDYFISRGYLYTIVKFSGQSAEFINLTLKKQECSSLELALNHVMQNTFKDAVKVENVKITLS